MPAPGTPVASTITSMRGSAISASALSVMKVAALFVRIGERRGGIGVVRPAGGVELAAGARDIEIGDAATCMPRVSRACDRNMVPNLPAPMTPTVTGFPAASRSRSLE